MAKNTTTVPAGVEAPEQIETRLGTLRFFDGFPDDGSVQTLFENLDFQRAVQAYLLALPAVNQAAMRKALLQWGPANTTLPIWEKLIDPRYIGLTANNNTTYSWMWTTCVTGRWSQRSHRKCSAGSTTSGTSGSSMSA